MFIDGPELFLVFAQLDTEENILSKFKNKKKSDQWSCRRCDNKKCLQTDTRELPDRKKSSSGQGQEELII